MSEQPTVRRGEPTTPRPVIARTADISVRTTERGLPIQLKIGPAAMSRAPENLAREILALCQLSALRLQVARRRDLRERGLSPTVLRDLNLATEEDLAKAEQEASDDEGPLDTWMTTP